jgi:ABC-type branched-subunit amino acid transport system substrate-binding protein
MKRNRLLTLLIGVCLVLVLAALPLMSACGTAGEEEEEEEEEETIKIGVVMEFSGDLGAMGERMINGARLAAEEINAAGGILGKQVELLEEDSKTDPAAGLDRVKKLVEIDGVQVIVGPMITGSSKLAIPYLADHEIPAITMSATNPLLSDLEGTDWFFRCCLMDDAQGRVLANFAIEQGYERVASMVLDNDYGKGVEAAFIEGLQEGGWTGEVVATVHYDEAKKDYRTELQQIKDNTPDAVLIVSYCDDGIIVFKQALEIGLDEIDWLGCDGNYGSGLFKEPSSAEFMEKAIAAGTRTVGFGSVYEKFVADYTDSFGEAPEIYCDTSYDAVWAAAKAIEAAGVYDGSAIRDALADLSFEGGSGPISFDEIGNRASGSFELWEVVEDATTETGYKNAQIKLVTLE